MRKKIAIIGAGNVATFIAKSLRKANNTITQVYSRDFKNAETSVESTDKNTDVSDQEDTDNIIDVLA